MRGDARDRRYAHHYVGRPATGGTHVIRLSAAAAVAALAGADVHELARPAQSGFRRPAGRGRLLKLVHVHVVVVAVARSILCTFRETSPITLARVRRLAP